MIDDWTAQTPPTPPDPGPPRESPIWPLAIAGGVALLLGLVFVAWHVLEQGWVEASHKLMLGGAAAAVLTAAAWPLAKRGQTEVAGALGGAGLGAWFSTWLFARHVYGFVSAGEAFVALVAAVLVCLVLADRLRLRLMAALAVIAACATPAVTSTGEAQLGELMVYQLGVLAAFAALDVRRNWPELPTLGLLGTWALLMCWGATNLDASTSTAFVACAGVLVVAGAASTWRVAMLAVGANEHAIARVLIGGLAAWATAGWAFIEYPPALRTTTLMLAAWHLGFALLVARRSQPLHLATLGLGWVMACAGGFMVGGLPAMLGWWTMMAIGMGLVVTGRTRYLGLVLPPALCAGGYVLVFPSTPWALGAGMVTALLLLGLALWHARDTKPIGALVLVGTALHLATVYVAGPEDVGARFLLGSIPVWLVVARAAIAPSTGLALAHRVMVTALALTGLVFWGAPSATPPLLVVAGLSVSGLVLLVRGRRMRDTTTYEPMGLITAGFVALLALRVLAPALPEHAEVVFTIVMTVVGLGLVIAGLRLGHASWRHVGLAAIVAGAAKLALLDMAHAALAVRGLSFIAVGGVLILGAYAYRRAARRDDSARTQ